MNRSGIRDIARVLKISPSTVIEELKKETQIKYVNEAVLKQLDLSKVRVEIKEHIEEAECDEMWGFVGSKAEQRWIWYAIDHQTGKILAYVLADRKDAEFIKLQGLLEPFRIKHFYTDDWGAYEQHIEPEKHSIWEKKYTKN